MKFRAALCVALLPLAAAADRAPALPPIEPGLWTISYPDPPGNRPRSMCATDVGQLSQLEHRGGGCTRFTVQADRRGATLHATCGGSGFGRTTVRLLTPRSVTIETQGVVAGLPFAYRADARRTGACARQTASAR